MGKLFIPIGLIAGLGAGAVARRLFAHVWGWIDDEEPPRPDHRDVPWAKILIAGALQGAIFRVVKSAVDHGTRRAFYNATGAWPGEERPEREV